MADDLRVRIVWTNDEASLRAAMAQAQQMLQSTSANIGYGSGGAGMPTPASVAASGGIRALSPAGLINAAGRPIGTGPTITAPAPTYNTTATMGGATSYAATGGGGAPAPAGRGRAPRGGGGGSGLARMSGPLGYAGRMMAIRGIFGAMGAIGEAATQQQSLSDMNRRVGEGAQQWRAFEDSILKVGVGLGATRQQMIELTNTFVSSVGKMGTTQTAQAVRGGMELAKTMGIAPESTMGFLGNEAKFMQGPNTDFTKLGAVLYTAVQSGMQGREEEVIAAIEELTDIVGKRLPDLGPGGIGGIGEMMRAFSATGIQGLMGQRGAQKIGTLDQFVSGQGTDAQNMILYRFAAQEARSQGLPTDALSIRKSLEGGLNEPFGQSVLKRISGAMPGGLGGEAVFSSITGLGTMRNAEAALKGIGGVVPGAGPAAVPGLQLTQADRNTEAMVDLGRAFQELGEKILPMLVEVDRGLAGDVRVLSGTLGGLSGQLAVLGAIVGTLGPIAGIGSLTGVGGALGGVIGGAGALGGAALVGGGLLAGGIGSLLWDKVAHQGEATTLDMALQSMGVKTPWSQLPGHARGGIVTSPQVARIGEGGPEMIMPLNPNDKGALRALARQVAVAYGLDPDIFERQINQESGFNYQALGDSGSSYGLGQINRPSHPDFFASGDPYDPMKNLTYSAAFDARLLSKYGNMRDALAAYNAGGGNIGAGYGYADKIMGGSGGTVNHELTVYVRQPDGSSDKFKMNLTSPYRNVVTSPNWGVSY